MKKNSSKGVIAGLMMSVMIGLQFYFIKNITKIFSENIFTLNALRFLIAFVVILPFTDKEVFRKAFNKRLILLSLISPFINITVQTYGVKMSSITAVGYISSLGPVITVIVGNIFLREKITKRQWISLGIAGVGTVLISSGKTEQQAVFGVGALFILAALVTRSVYAVLSKKESSEYTFLQLSFAQIMWGLIYFSAAMLVFERDFLSYQLINTLISFNLRDILSLLYVSLCSITIVNLLNNYALSQISIRLSAVMSNLTFVVTLFSGVLLMGESISIKEIFGALFIIGGVLLIKNK